MNITKAVQHITTHKDTVATDGKKTIFCNSFGAIQVKDTAYHLKLDVETMSSDWEIVNEPWYGKDESSSPTALLYSVFADLHLTKLSQEDLPYGSAKFIYDRWRNDPEVFNVLMYRLENGKKILMSEEEISR